jgi:tRNA(Ile)-lysidine synthase
MRTTFEQRVLEAIRRERAILPGARVAVAVSGGADSVALLRILDTLANDLGITLSVVHLNHSLRGLESDADAQFVGNLARERNLRFVLCVEDVAKVAEREGWNLEDAGRRVRRQFYERLSDEGIADLVAVAHTEDDQAETLLAHVMRGTGLTGLGGIHPVAGPIVRPLLETRRQDLREYLGALKQEWREDSTNNDTRRMRARIRKILLPLIEREFSPGIVGHLNNLARFTRAEEAFWTVLVEGRFEELARKTDESVRIKCGDLLEPLESLNQKSRSGSKSFLARPVSASLNAGSMRAVTARLIRRLYEAARGDCRELSAAHVEQIIHLANHLKSGRSLELPGGIVVSREFGDLVFARSGVRSGQEPANDTARRHEYEYAIDLPLMMTTTLSVAELGKRLSLNLIDWPNAESDTIRDPRALDADLLRAPLILRNWRPGDSFSPHGRRDVRKLKQMMLADRVPASQRRGWPVLESGGQVVWALGMTPAEGCCAGAKTRKGLLILEEKG